ncbi:hypothetical protein BYT27DRAFT_7169561 [Phlegmacium glaucopus]|nr:hypothetical protein BYT27DRAFT_7169561 [Phlegmacium glaucopus]
MPTATTTITKSSRTTPLPLKVAFNLRPSSVTTSDSTPPPPPMAQTSKAAALRSLYNRAARAFVLRDITLTYSLLQSAFALLNPPNAVPDSLSDHRRKWDILRITFESTVYTSPPSSTVSLPETLRTNLMESPQALATSIYSRSLALFTPSNGGLSKTVLNPAYLPYQVLSTLVYCTLKIDAPDIGRVVIEDWLARREPHYSLDPPAEPEGDGYEKTLELYTLHILPKLEQWEYAKEFLEYESELPSQRRENLRTSLNSLYTQAMAVRQPFKAVPLLTSTSTPPRSCSPTPSCSSSSSSLSNTSTHTVVPSTHGTNRSSAPSASTSLTQSFSSSSSVTSSGTATPRALHTHLAPNGNHRPTRSHSQSRTSSSASSAYSSLPRSTLGHQAAASPANLNTYDLIRVSLAPYLTSKRMTTFLVLFLLIPLLSFILRMRRRKRQLSLDGVAATAASHADLVRKRLQAAGGRVEGSLLARAWGEIVRVVGDTVKMAGSGLV